MYHENLKVRLHNSADLTIFRLWSHDVKEDWPDQVILSLHDTDKNHLLGKFTYFKQNKFNKSAQFRGLVDPTKRNVGLGKEMLKQCSAYFFANTKLEKLYCEVAENNHPAIRILEKGGFHLDGSLRAHYHDDGKLYNLRIYSIFRKEWEEHFLK